MAMFTPPLILEKLLLIFWKIRILESGNWQERLMSRLPLFSDWFQVMRQYLLKWLFVSLLSWGELRLHGFVSRRHGALKKRKEKLTYLISQQNTARQKFRLMLNHRAVILAASESGGYQVPNSALFSASRISSIFRTPRLLYRKLSTCLSEYGDLSMNHFPYCSVLSM